MSLQNNVADWVTVINYDIVPDQPAIQHQWAVYGLSNRNSPLLEA